MVAPELILKARDVIVAKNAQQEIKKAILCVNQRHGRVFNDRIGSFSFLLFSFFTTTETANKNCSKLWRGVV